MFKPISDFPNIIWPSIYPPHGSSMLALQFQFEQSQWWTAEQIREQQLRQLSLVYHHAYKTVPLYNKKYKNIAIKTGVTLNYKQWLSLPILKRSELQSAGNKIVTEKLPKEHGKMSDVSTSGSTGRTVKLKSTNINSLFWLANTLREHIWHKRDFSKSLAVIRILGKENSTKVHRSKNWGAATEVVTQTGLSYAYDVRNSIDKQIEFLLEIKPDYLLTYPSMAFALAQYITKHNIVMPSLLSLRTFGETLSEETRDYCEAIFKTSIVDMYSCQETGYLALQCPEQAHYHVASESVLVEVLDENDQPCKPNEIGRIVISSLQNFATPLLRYDIDDYAMLGDECSCGRGHLVLKKIMGRSRNMLLFPDGKKIWPVFGTNQFDKIIAIKQFQFVQKTAQKLEMNLVVDTAPSAAQKKQLKDHILHSLGYNFELKFNYKNIIERTKGGKFEDFVSEMK